MQYKDFTALFLTASFIFTLPGSCSASGRGAEPERKDAVIKAVIRRDASDSHRIRLVPKKQDAKPVEKLAASAKEAARKQKDARQKESVSKQKQKASVKKTEAAKKQEQAKLFEEKDGRAYLYGTQLPENYQNISIFGEAEASRSQAVAFIKSNNPDVRLECSVEELVDLYWEEAGREEIRPDMALSQALVETGFFRYGGDVHHKQNNFCGLGTTGGGVKGAEFDTPQIGVRAHIQHLLAYTQKKRPSTKIVDPRYEMAHRLRMERGMIDTWYGLNGTWAMGSLYCEKIMANYQKMLAVQAAADENVKDSKVKDKDKKKDKKDKKRKEEKKGTMRERIDKLLKERR